RNVPAGNLPRGHSRREKKARVRTFTPKPDEVERSWYVIDAADVVLGRLASQAAQLLRGKHKPVFAPHVDAGDFVVIINAEKVALTGNKREDKLAYRTPVTPAACATPPTPSCSRRTPSARSRRRC